MLQSIPAKGIVNNVHDNTIFVPEGERERDLANLPISVRLAHLLEFSNIRRLGDLHGLNLDELAAYRSCGPKTVSEIQTLVESVHGEIGECYSVPAEAHDISPFDLPTSIPLAHLLQEKGINRLGDLHGRKPADLKSARYYTQKALYELDGLLQRITSGEFDLSTTPFTTAHTAELLRLIHDGISKLSARSRRIIKLRYAGNPNRNMSLTEVGQRLKLSGARAAGLEARALTQIKAAGGPKLKGYLRGLAGVCADLVCPLTPSLLTHWLGKCATQLKWQPEAYIRLLGKLNPDIPAWPRGLQPSIASDSTKRIIAALEDVFCAVKPCLPLPKAFHLVCAQLRQDKPTVLDFLKVLKQSPLLAVEFSATGQGTVQQRRLHISQVAKTILLTSGRAMTAETILSKARVKFGKQLVPWTHNSFKRAIYQKHGILQLGPRVIGLHHHIRLPERLWEPARNAAYIFLKAQEKPMITSAIVSARQFKWDPRPTIMNSRRFFVKTSVLWTWGIGISA